LSLPPIGIVHLRHTSIIGEIRHDVEGRVTLAPDGGLLIALRS